VAVVASVRFRSGTVTVTGTAGGSGGLTLSFPVGVDEPAGVAVPVSVAATSAPLGATAFATTTFTPV
jgi:hypothetical protein